MGKYQTAKEHGEKSLTLAEEAGEPQWQLQASVLVAQSECKSPSQCVSHLNSV